MPHRLAADTVRRIIRQRVVAAVVAAAALVTACGLERRAAEDLVEARTEGTFYTVPAPLPAGRPGDLIRSERLLGAPGGATAWRVLYHSTAEGGARTAVSGVVVAPTRPPPAGGWPVVSWGHPTTGAAGRCAPSVGDDPFLLIEGLHELLAAGYVVTASDYSGMGAEGPPSYLLGVTEGNNVLDAYHKAYGADLSAVLTPAGVAAVPRMAPLCLFGQNSELHAIADPLVGRFLANDPATTDPWATRLAANTPGHSPVGVPVLIAQGGADTLVKPETTDTFVQRICAAGEHVDYRTYPDATHATIAERVVPLLIEWLGEVQAGRTPPATCPT